MKKKKKKLVKLYYQVFINVFLKFFTLDLRSSCAGNLFFFIIFASKIIKLVKFLKDNILYYLHLHEQESQWLVNLILYYIELIPYSVICRCIRRYGVLLIYVFILWKLILFLFYVDLGFDLSSFIKVEEIKVIFVGLVVFYLSADLLVYYSEIRNLKRNDKKLLIFRFKRICKSIWVYFCVIFLFFLCGKLYVYMFFYMLYGGYYFIVILILVGCLDKKIFCSQVLVSLYVYFDQLITNILFWIGSICYVYTGIVYFIFCDFFFFFLATIYRTIMVILLLIVFCRWIVWSVIFMFFVNFFIYIIMVLYRNILWFSVIFIYKIYFVKAFFGYITTLVFFSPKLSKILLFLERTVCLFFYIIFAGIIYLLGILDFCRIQSLRLAKLFYRQVITFFLDVGFGESSKWIQCNMKLRINYLSFVYYWLKILYFSWNWYWWTYLGVFSILTKISGFVVYMIYVYYRWLLWYSFIFCGTVCIRLIKFPFKDYKDLNLLLYNIWRWGIVGGTKRVSPVVYNKAFKVIPSWWGDNSWKIKLLLPIPFLSVGFFRDICLILKSFDWLWLFFNPVLYLILCKNVCMLVVFFFFNSSILCLRIFMFIKGKYKLDEGDENLDVISSVVIRIFSGTQDWIYESLRFSVNFLRFSLVCCIFWLFRRVFGFFSFYIVILKIVREYRVIRNKNKIVRLEHRATAVRIFIIFYNKWQRGIGVYGYFRNKFFWENVTKEVFNDLFRFFFYLHNVNKISLFILETDFIAGVLGSIRDFFISVINIIFVGYILCFYIFLREVWDMFCYIKFICFFGLTILVKSLYYKLCRFLRWFYYM